MDKENQKDPGNKGAYIGSSSPIKGDSSRASTASQLSIERELGLPTCRVCHCVESDKRGDIVLGFLGISPFLGESNHVKEQSKSSSKTAPKEFVSPTGEVFVCDSDVEMGESCYQDTLTELGCSCKDDLALVHYGCALKWFVNHGSTICEICGSVATNIRSDDFRKILASLKEYEALRDRTASGEPNPAQMCDNSSVDPDAIAAIRRQRRSEIYLWFNPHGNNHQNNNSNGNVPVASLAITEQPSNYVNEDVAPPQNPATKWAVEGTGILLATGLLTVILAWLIAPRVGKRTAKNGLHILLGGVCALALVVFFRFFVLTRIRYGPARYWAILFVFWFLVFGIWASRTHSTHGT
uniref:RING-CH-type domain-containing protein n=1 Tax=Opuntia streptacantha TaxID=393608 RepID=A0A7C9AJ70_OPUST